jgi:hypothetical protein
MRIPPKKPFFPKLATAKATAIAADPDVFTRARTNLLRAVDSRNDRQERFWRQVFGAYTEILYARKRRHRLDRDAARRLRIAHGYFTGTLPPEENPDVPF